MEQWIASNWSSILLTLVTSGALAFCGYLWKQVKEYKRLLKQEEIKQEEIRIDEKLEPIIEDMEELRNYVREVDKDEKHKIKLIVQSYRFRLSQLCRLYLKQGYMTVDQYDQLNEFFHLYESLGGNGEAKALYEKVVNTLDVKPEEK